MNDVGGLGFFCCCFVAVGGLMALSMVMGIFRKFTGGTVRTYGGYGRQHKPHHQSNWGMGGGGWKPKPKSFGGPKWSGGGHKGGGGGYKGGGGGYKGGGGGYKGGGAKSKW